MIYRYRSNAALWWPANGEDIDVRRLPTRPGKAVQLELKTTTVAGAGLHDVLVDLGQLWEYRQRSLGRQPFYAFPRPDWHGNLTEVAFAQGRPVTELAFARSGPGWWFADWMVLLTAAEVAGMLQKELAAHQSRDRGTKKRLVRFDLRHSIVRPVVTWGSSATTAPAIGWREFWATLDECGRAGWPQLIHIPERVVRARGPYLPSQVAEMLREAADIIGPDEWDDRSLVTVEPDANGNYQIAATRLDDLGRSGEDRTDQIGGQFGDSGEDRANEAADHRLIVFIEAQALRPL